MDVAQIQLNVKNMMRCFSKEAFVFKLLRAYGINLIDADLTLVGVGSEVRWENMLLFKACEGENLFDLISHLEDDWDKAFRFIVVSDFEMLLAINTQSKKVLDILLMDLPNHYAFFLPLRTDY